MLAILELQLGTYRMNVTSEHLSHFLCVCYCAYGASHHDTLRLQPYTLQICVQNEVKGVGLCRKPIRWYIMTSAATDKDTKNFFRQRSYFGLNQSQIVFFQQVSLYRPHHVFYQDALEDTAACRNFLSCASNHCYKCLAA